MSSPIKDNFVLSPRLLAVAEMIRRTGKKRVADVGTDHAKLPLFLIREGICDFCYAADIREGPLMQAKKNIEMLGIGRDQILPILSDGLKSIPDDYDCVSICGMGGLLIYRIIAETTNCIPFIIAPMSSTVELCRELYSNGYKIIDATVAREENRFYPIYRVEKKSDSIEYESFDCLFPRALRLQYLKNNEIREYIRFNLEIMEKNVSCREKSSKNEPELPYLQDLVYKTKNFIESCEKSEEEII